ncbi:MBL fold metallo-hydrolase [Virgibacillus pantothenticus]|uniref:YtnP family quorum-quenching lactonase n=1 Tax=Virgibacillus pantothenticus TaxID=1473 RepID=UPI001B2B215B|nr:MBL fold metallo-hydrolase [Virgibacillus pantothenticus]GIP65768.1 MBL fold metallo-hydrolase [Virgibacillus pantothenticus]
MEKLKVGRATLTWLKGGVTNLDGGAMFGVVPKVLWQPKYPTNELNQITLRTDPILLQLDGKNYLIDSGIGQNKLSEKQLRNFGVSEQSQVMKDLATLGLSPNNIDGMLMTHMHFDHASGLTNLVGDMYESVFKQAVIYTSEKEWEEMRQPNIRSKNTYWRRNWEAITEQVQTFTNEIMITDGLKMVHTGGHSNGHSIIVFEQDDTCWIHMADIMPTYAHQNKLWVLAYDDYPVTSVHQKEKWMDYGYRKQAWYTFYHDAYYRAIKFNESGERVDQLERKQSPNEVHR